MVPPYSKVNSFTWKVSYFSAGREREDAKTIQKILRVVIPQISIGTPYSPAPSWWSQLVSVVISFTMWHDVISEL